MHNDILPAIAQHLQQKRPQLNITLDALKTLVISGFAEIAIDLGTNLDSPTLRIRIIHRTYRHGYSQVIATTHIDLNNPRSITQLEQTVDHYLTANHPMHHDNILPAIAQHLKQKWPTLVINSSFVYITIDSSSAHIAIDLDHTTLGIRSYSRRRPHGTSQPQQFTTIDLCHPDSITQLEQTLDHYLHTAWADS